MFLFLFLFGTIVFCAPQKAKATDEINYQGVVINELMWMGSSKSTSDEWVELYNTTDQKIDLSGWQLTKFASGSGETSMLTIPQGKRIYPHDFLLISNYDIGDANTILNIKPDLVDVSITISNTTLQVKLLDATSKLIDVAGNKGLPLAGNNTNPNPKASMERNELIGDGAVISSWHTATLSSNLISTVSDKATPKNSSNTAPTLPINIGPTNGQKLTSDQTLHFVWSASTDAQNDEISYQLEISCSNTFDSNFLITNILINNYDLTADELIGELGQCSGYFWRVNASDGDLVNSSLPSSFILTKPVYSNAIMINELMPNPTSDEATSEWIELYNNSAEAVNLKGWALQDSEGSIHRYTLTDDLWINPFGYIFIYRNISGITLNNDTDGVQIYQPDDTLLFETPKFLNAGEGLAWAKGADGNWSWTDMPTASAENIIHLESSSTTTNSNDDQSLNSEPIEISTGDFQNYLNYLVQITGEVTETSGDTFYLDDGSGEVKIYIQSKTGIDKPEMHKGDIFQIVGIVDLYGKTWRILPRTLDDIKLIDRALTVSLAAKKTTKSKIAAKPVLAKTASSINPNVLAASATKPSTTNNSSSSFWLQFLETAMGIAAILLIYLIFQISRQKKEKISRQIGGHFGQDDT